MSFLVVGEPGPISDEVERLLTEAGVPVTRRGLGSAEELRAAAIGCFAVFLDWPYDRASAEYAAADSAVDVVGALAGEGRRFVLLSTHAVRDHEPPASFHGTLELLVRAATEDWTALRISMPASITLSWIEQLRATGVVRGPYAQAARTLVDERDVAEVAARVLLDGGHAGRAYYVTGPAALTHADRARILGETFGESWRYQEVPRAEFREQLLATWSAEHADGILDHMAEQVDNPERPTDVVERITGHPARSLAEWARAHAAAFTR
ncbi:nucleoside-diphosphate sugar epimerase [Crossiella sp. CA198]|uniref:nucleoside-diphosphate sugar epimerase n=1 Tax=Crossiella sp. CA198 TaxID=3455607 RepID=UPI003F8D69F6